MCMLYHDDDYYYDNYVLPGRGERASAPPPAS